MSKLFFIPISLIAAVLGFYWLDTNSEVENRAVDQADISPGPNVENDSIKAISVSGVSAELDQLQETYSKPKGPAGSKRINPDQFIDPDDYSYQHEDSELINVGEVKDADDTSYQRDDSEVINVGKLMDVEMLDSTYWLKRTAP